MREVKQIANFSGKLKSKKKKTTFSSDLHSFSLAYFLTQANIVLVRPQSKPGMGKLRSWGYMLLSFVILEEIISIVSK